MDYNKVIASFFSKEKQKEIDMFADLALQNDVLAKKEKNISFNLTAEYKKTFVGEFILGYQEGVLSQLLMTKQNFQSEKAIEMLESCKTDKEIIDMIGFPKKEIMKMIDLEG